MRTYNLYFPQKWLLFAVFGVCTTLFLIGGVTTAFSVGHSGPPRLLASMFIAIPGLIWYQVLIVPHAITLDIDGTVVFKAVLRSRVFNVGEVLSIKPRFNQVGYFVLDFGRGKQRFIGQFTGFHDFITRLKAANPNVEVLGC
jgi:hypothetical protein